MSDRPRAVTVNREAFAAVDEVGKSESDLASADRHMRDALNLGADDVKKGQITCEALQTALNRLEPTKVFSPLNPAYLLFPRHKFVGSADTVERGLS
jgi:hypothetical protein